MAKTKTKISTGVIITTIFIIVFVVVYQYMCISNKKEAFEDDIKNVKLYQHCNKQGAYDDIEGGRYAQFNMISSVVGENNLSGIDIPRNTKVTLYSDQSFKGDSKSFTTSVDCLTNHSWNDRAKSIVIQPLVAIYPECSFLGEPLSCDVGTHNLEWGKPIKSIKIPAYHSVTLMDTYSETPKTVKREFIGPLDIPCLDDVPYGATDSWSAKVRTIEVTQVAELFVDSALRERMLTIPTQIDKVYEIPSNFRSIRVPPRLKALVYYNKDAALKDTNGEKASYVFLKNKRDVYIARPKDVPTTSTFNIFIKIVMANIGRTEADVDAEMATWKW